MKRLILMLFVTFTATPAISAPISHGQPDGECQRCYLQAGQLSPSPICCTTIPGSGGMGAVCTANVTCAAQEWCGPRQLCCSRWACSNCQTYGACTISP